MDRVGGRSSTGGRGLPAAPATRLGVAPALVLLCAISSAAQTVDSTEGLCPVTERTTVSYNEMYQVSRMQRTTVSCEFWGWSRCTRYRRVFSTETRVAYREVSNVVDRCCIGWTMQDDGVCTLDVTDEPPSQQGPALNQSTPPAPAVDQTVSVGSSGPLPPSGPSPSSSPSPSVPVEIAGPGNGGSEIKGGAPNGDDTASSGERAGMIGGLVGVVVALVVMVSLLVFFVSRRKRQSRKQRTNADPAVAFGLLKARSDPQAPVPDIYTEIPDRDGQGNGASPGAVGACSAQGDDEYDLAFMPMGPPSSKANPYQDVREGCNGRSARPPGPAGSAAPAAEEEDHGKDGGQEVRLTHNGAAFSKDKPDPTVYQNVTDLDVVVQAPDIYDVVGQADGGTGLDRTHSVPTDPDNEAYNTIMIGPAMTSPTEAGRDRYDRLNRQRGASRMSSDSQLDAPVPAPSQAYAALGAEPHRAGYDKLERPETHGLDAERRAAGVSTGPSTYNELSAVNRRADYDKLDRLHSGEHGGSADEPAPASGVEPSASQYDTVVAPPPPTAAVTGDGEIYENMPKTPAPKDLDLTASIPRGTGAGLNHDPVPAPRPIYDLVPVSPRRLSSPVYDAPPLPSPRSVDPTPPNTPTAVTSPSGRPVYDTPPVYDRPPVSLKSTLVRDATPTDPPSPEAVVPDRPVYDTPPVRWSGSTATHSDEICPVYENTATTRK